MKRNISGKSGDWACSGSGEEVENEKSLWYTEERMIMNSQSHAKQFSSEKLNLASGSGELIITKGSHDLFSLTL